MPITKEWLKKAAISQSFSRGKDYYDQVEDLVKKGNTYSAIVCGSDEYEVSVTDNPKCLRNFWSDPSVSDPQNDPTFAQLPTGNFYDAFFLKQD